MDLIAQTLASTTLGDADRFLNLAAFPLLGTSDYHRDYLTLRAAVDAGTAHVREVSQGGSVPDLAIENSGKEPVLVFEGEELIGAKQNRTANVTVLAPPGKTTRIPVTCVEAGRWGYRSREMSPSEQMHFSRGRSAKLASVAASMRQRGTRHADQGAVWDEISSKSARMHVASPTSAMSDVFESHRTRLDDYASAFRARPGQTGAVFAINERIEGLELFDCTETLTEMLPKLVRSYAIDAIETAAYHRRNPTGDDARAFVEPVRTAAFEAHDAVGVGTEVRISTHELIAAGLIAEGRVVHLAAFAVGESESRPGRESDGLSPLHSRRRWMRR